MQIGEILTLLGKTTSNYLATLVRACVCDQQFLRATKFQKIFATLIYCIHQRYLVYDVCIGFAA